MSTTWIDLSPEQGNAIWNAAEGRLSVRRTPTHEWGSSESVTLTKEQAMELGGAMMVWGAFTDDPIDPSCGYPESEHHMNGILGNHSHEGHAF